MTIPAGIKAVRVTGRFRRPDGTPYKGSVVFQAPVMIELEQALTIISGRATVDLDEQGEFSLLLVATDNPGMDPTGWVYTVTVVLDDGTTRTGSVTLSSTVTEIDITKLMPADPAQLNYVPVKGERGASILSGAARPTAANGTVGDFWIDSTKTDAWLLYGPKTADGWPQASLPLGPVTTWRVRDLPDPAVADAVYAGPAPTITTAQTSTPAAGNIKYAPDPVALSGTDRRGTFTWAGAGNFAIGVGTPDNTYVLPLSRYPNTYASGQANWSVEFGTDAQVIQLRFKHISAATTFRLSIDGRKLTDLMQPSGGVVAGIGLTHLLTIDFGSAIPRRLRFDFTAMPFGGIYLPPTANMWQVPLQGGRFMVLGDSLSDGSAFNTGAGCGTWVDRVGRMLGCTDVWREARGSTGYVATGTFAAFGTRAEVDVIPWEPDRLIIWGGYNDASSNQSQIAAAAATLFDRIRTALPRCQVYVIGCWSPTGTAAASHVNTTATLRTAAANARFPFISPQTGQVYDANGTLVATHGPWITGSGNAGSLKADGNADLYVGSDGVHATDAGHVYIARRIMAFLRTVTPA
ncbi:SGNH/GDSL hydrolase family protein (plasmid) [Streptomyces sp. NBC_00536]|uniref:SGNH/GDSL hydrolase family protein n=1 Tax=Streptomyces sp. NBC_00536 TaxID=2975769 RepID=UPI002E819AE9|nr:SGNH/GDSL hydrolase family protein [Streptomyces sp. NBC_00536]WUC84438.1 SGNH/GDSL hydrolase family protein [Streptomyces sp. NBC_00536]